MKCVLYVFGKTPKELKSWIETTKLINMELLKQMINYDPTVLQPKNRFVRIKKLLKTIPRGDVKRKGSMPALIVFSWLIVSLDLREKAVASRLALQKNEKGDTLMADSDNSNSLEDNDIDEFSDEESESKDELRNSATDLAISSS
ncbi:hypothetical protein BKA69DRAFT_319323 [Paraphysoderma sedebokerense]|nr:hypothetical protein BKA69DRAFT_319323 [Paraphysoderma sedebokerense]